MENRTDCNGCCWYHLSSWRDNIRSCDLHHHFDPSPCGDYRLERPSTRSEAYEIDSKAMSEAYARGRQAAEHGLAKTRAENLERGNHWDPNPFDGLSGPVGGWIRNEWFWGYENVPPEKPVQVFHSSE